MGQILTVSGAKVDFHCGVELNALFDRGDIKQREGLSGDLYYRDDSGHTGKFSITARELFIGNTSKVVFDLVPTVDFRDTCVNIFRAMLVVLNFRISRFVSPERKHEVQHQFEQMLATRQAQTRFPMLDEPLHLLDELGATRAEPGHATPDPERAKGIFNRLTTIQNVAKDFAACRTPEKSVDVVTRMERAGYSRGLFSLEDGGYTQPFLFAVKRDEPKDKLQDDRSMLLKDGQTMVHFDTRVYRTPKDVESFKVGTRETWSEEDCAEWESAIAKEGEVRDMAEKLYGGEWTDKQVRLFAAALDEMIFISQQFIQVLVECPARGETGSPEAKLMCDYAAKLRVPLAANSKDKALDSSRILAAGFASATILKELCDDQMVRAFFAHQVASDVRLTEGMRSDEIADVVNTFSTFSPAY